MGTSIAQASAHLAQVFWRRGALSLKTLSFLFCSVEIVLYFFDMLGFVFVEKGRLCFIFVHLKLEAKLERGTPEASLHVRKVSQPSATKKEAERATNAELGANRGRVAGMLHRILPCLASQCFAS
eukprot:2290742-Amphidinium_carterae.1